MGINTAIVGEQELTRIAIEEILSRASDIDFVGGFANVGTLLETKPQIDVLLLGYNQNQPDFADLMARLKSMNTDMHVIVLGRQWSETGIHAVLECGADGVIDCSEPLHDLLAAGVRRVARGKQFLSPDVVQVYTNAPPGTTLTEREFDIIRMMSDGAITKEIAAALGVTRKTINRNQNNICKKWNLRSRDQIVGEAIRRGIILK
ncbi:LuxR C-terminal-related transcriptional regulator [Chloroflexota bacterium]